MPKDLDLCQTVRSRGMDKRILALIGVALIGGCSFDTSPVADGPAYTDSMSNDGFNSPPPANGFAGAGGSFAPTDAATGGTGGTSVPPVVPTDDASVPDPGPIPPTCSQGEVRCVGQTTQLCLDAAWVNRATCDNDEMCVNGVCEDIPEPPPTPVCTPGELDCSGKALLTCNAEGFWLGAPCPYACSNGACTGVCDPGTKNCQGDTPRTCNGQGQWVSEPACATSCTAGTCDDPAPQDCVPGTTECQGDTPRSCNGQGQWVAGSECPFVCSAGSCTGVCDPGAKDCQGDVPRTCNNQGQWANESACQFQCSAGSCTGVCNPGDKQCDGQGAQTCNGQGQWVTDEVCPFICSAGSCSGECNPGDSDCQGDVPRNCNGSSQWVTGNACQFQCSAGACNGVCNPGEMRCNGDQIQTCNGSYQWDAPVACPGADNAQGYCEADACTWDCDLDFDDCDGNPGNGCEVDLNNDDMNCGSCGHDCCGGSCGDGACEAHDVVTGISGYTFDVDENNIYWFDRDGDYNVQQTDRFSGDSITLGTTTSEPQGISVQGSTLAWSAATYDMQLGWSGGVYETPVGGGLSVELPLSKAKGHLFRNSTTLFSVFVGSTTVSPYIDGVRQPYLTIDANSIQHYAASEDYVYWIDSTADIVGRTPLAGGGPDETVVPDPGIGEPYGLHTDDTNLYYVDLSGLWKKPLAGGDAVKLVSDNGGLGNVFTSDGSYVYYTASGDTLRKVAVDGSSDTALTTGITYPGGGRRQQMKAVDECVYWVDGSDIRVIAITP